MNQISFIIIALIVSYFLLVMAFISKDYIMGLLAGMAIFITGVFISIHNIDYINNLLTQAIGLINIMLGLYIFINASKEKIENTV